MREYSWEKTFTAFPNNPLLLDLSINLRKDWKSFLVSWAAWIGAMYRRKRFSISFSRVFYFEIFCMAFNRNLQHVYKLRYTDSLVFSFALPSSFFFLLPILHCALLFSGGFCLYKTNIAVFIIETWCFPTLSLPFDTLFSCTVFRLINKVDAEKKWRRKLPAEKNERRGKHIKPRQNSILYQNWKIYSFSELKFKVMRQILIIKYYRKECFIYCL